MSAQFVRRPYLRKSKLQPAPKEIILSDSWYTPKQVATILKICPRTLRNYCRKGLIAFYKPKRLIQFNKADVEDFITRCRRFGAEKFAVEGLMFFKKSA